MPFDPIRLLNLNYLFDTNPGVLEIQSTAYGVAVLSVLLSGLLLFLLSKDFIKYSLERRKRQIISAFLKNNLLFSVILLVIVFLRTQLTGFLSLRIWGVIVLLLMLVNLILTLLKLRQKVQEKDLIAAAQTGERVTSTDNYQKYLPKKKKKK